MKLTSSDSPVVELDPFFMPDFFTANRIQPD